MWSDIMYINTVEIFCLHFPIRSLQAKAVE